MRAFVMVFLLLAAALAGCSGSDDAASASGKGAGGKGRSTGGVDGADIPVGKVSATTGAVRGVVVDAAIVPVADADVSVVHTGGEMELKTDAQGRFVFSEVPPGEHFLNVRHPFFEPFQTTVKVVANVPDPDVVRVQLKPLFAQKPYTTQVSWEGFFECSQAGAGIYSSSNCVVDPCPRALPATQCNTLPTRQLNNVTHQEREWHSDVQPGWRTLVWDIIWEGDGQFSTSERMGIVVSTYKPERDPAHWFAQVSGGNPLTLRIDNGTVHETAASQDPQRIPDEGMQQMSYFVSVRAPEGSTCVLLCAPPGVAINQSFKVIHTQFYNAPAPEGWSATKDDLPF